MNTIMKSSSKSDLATIHASKRKSKILRRKNKKKSSKSTITVMDMGTETKSNAMEI